MFDGEAAWNGNKLKGLQQINIFFTHLESGKHSLEFLANQSPHLGIVKIYQASLEISRPKVAAAIPKEGGFLTGQANNEQNVLFEPAKNYQIESGDKRPWMIFVLIDLALEKLNIQASASQTGRDDDDLQLKINGERQTNQDSKLHRYWYWCGKILEGKKKEFNQEVHLPQGLHYIELWADNEPQVDSVLLQFSKFSIERRLKKGKIALYRDIVAGIRYFLWIFNSFYKNTTQAVEKTVAAYNWKIKNVSDIFSDGPIDIKKLPEETARHVLCVAENTQKKNWKNIIWPALILAVAIITGSLLAVWPSRDAGKLLANVAVIPTTNSHSSVFPCPRLEAKDESVVFIDKNCETARTFTFYDLHAEEFFGRSSTGQNFRFALYDDITHNVNAQRSQDGVIYFLLTTSGFCGSGGCGYVLYGYDTANQNLTVIETDVDSVIRMMLSPDGKKIALASAAFYDICEANSYLRIIDLTSRDRKIISGFKDQELPITHIKNLQWLSNNALMFSTLHNGDCDPITIGLEREKEFIYNVLHDEMKSRFIKEYNVF